jgi:hypothetical protein
LNPGSIRGTLSLSVSGVVSRCRYFFEMNLSGFAKKIETDDSDNMSYKFSVIYFILLVDLPSCGLFEFGVQNLR